MATIPAFDNSLRLANWEMARVPDAPYRSDELDFQAAEVPGTVASNLRKQGLWKLGDHRNFDAERWCFRCYFEGEPCQSTERLLLHLVGIATLSEVRLNGRLILESDSMFAYHVVDISKLFAPRNELLITFLPLQAALIAQRSKKPALRWKTQVVVEQQLRWFRTTLLGRAPGFAPEPEPVGPWRPVFVVRQKAIAVQSYRRTAWLDGTTGVLECAWQIQALHGSARPMSGELVSGDLSSSLLIQAAANNENYLLQGSIRIPNVSAWWPHTHGDPSTVPLRAMVTLESGSELTLEDRPVGFRTIEWEPVPAGPNGFQVRVNGVPIFCRGVVWSPCDLISLSQEVDEIRRRLRLFRDAGFNLIRVVGTAIYESDAFHSACEELGLLVWQDMMFANMDYPFEDEAFSRKVLAEAQAELSKLALYASTAILCGNSEIQQQITMLGLDASLARISFFDDQLPALVTHLCPGVPYLPSAPFGGELPFRTDRGVANYFGVGAYLRPVEDARRAAVCFASECLAFANVPEPEAIESFARATRTRITPVSPAWRAFTPRDLGTGWDFDDVRDKYLSTFFSVNPFEIRYSDPERYWQLSRVVSGEIMAEVFGEWRRSDSPCTGGIILSGADFQPGAGWGILDLNGLPKAPYWFLKRLLAPSAVWITDEGLNGLDIHLANDNPSPLSAQLHLGLYRNGEQKVEDTSLSVECPGHGAKTFHAEQLLNRFVDISHSYRFGPPGHDLVAATIGTSSGAVLSQAFFFPLGRPSTRVPISALGLSGEAVLLEDRTVQVITRSKRFAYAVCASSRGFLPSDAYFHLAPEVERSLTLAPHNIMDSTARVLLTALNAEGTLSIPVRSLQ